MDFPKGFIWGSATAAHQVEGNNTNNDIWLLEHVEHSMFKEPSLDTCDHFHRYPEDIKLLADLGFNSYRFSIEWARVEPEEGHFSAAAIDHYRRMLVVCHNHGIKPFVTFHHFSSPQWLIKAGGWESDDTPALFARYCGRLAADLGDLIAGGCTINEANIGRVLISSGVLPPMDLIRASPGWVEASDQLGISADDFNPFICSDVDTDSCDDCTSGTYNITDDGTDFDEDGLCDAGDTDDDDDGALDDDDSDDSDPNICSDIDHDTCDDCSSGTYDVTDDVMIMMMMGYVMQVILMMIMMVFPIHMMNLHLMNLVVQI